MTHTESTQLGAVVELGFDIVLLILNHLFAGAHVLGQGLQEEGLDKAGGAQHLPFVDRFGSCGP